MTGESFFFAFGSAAAGSHLGHDAIHRTQHTALAESRGDLLDDEEWRNLSTRGGVLFQVAYVRDLRSRSLWVGLH